MATNSNPNTIGTLVYRKVQRTPQTGENAGQTLWYATSVPGEEIDFDQFITHMQNHGSPFSRGTLQGVMLDALACLQELILDGKSVRLSDLGLFSLGIKSRAETTKEKVNADSILDVHLIVRNTKAWSNASLKGKCKYKLISKYGTTDDTDDNGDSGDNGDNNPDSGNPDSGSTDNPGSTPGGGNQNPGSGGGSAEID